MNGFQTTIEIQQSVNLPNLFYIEKDRIFPHLPPDLLANMRTTPTLMTRFRTFIETKMNKKTEVFRLMNLIGKRKLPKRIHADPLDKHAALPSERPVMNTFHTKEDSQVGLIQPGDLHMGMQQRNEFEADEGFPINPSTKRETASNGNPRLEDSAGKQQDPNMISEQDALKPLAAEPKKEPNAPPASKPKKLPGDKKIGCSPCSII